MGGRGVDAMMSKGLKKGGEKEMRKRGFTLVEIMIVVAIIGLLAAIAIPNFIQARTKAQTNSCVANLKQVQGAVSLWGLDAGKQNTDSVQMTNLVTTYIKTTPYCSLDSNKVGYTLTTVGTDPVCPRDPTNHKLP